MTTIFGGRALSAAATGAVRSRIRETMRDQRGSMAMTSPREGSGVVTVSASASGPSIRPEQRQLGLVGIHAVPEGPGQQVAEGIGLQQEMLPEARREQQIN